MQKKIKNTLRTILDKWLQLERRQQIRIGAIAAVVLAVLAVTLYITLRPTMVVLHHGLGATDIGEIQAALDEVNIANRVTANATAIEVRQRDVNAAKIALAVADVPSGGRGTFTYFDALSFSGMGTTETTRRENFMRVAQEDLARNLRLFDGVRDAQVHLFVPDSHGWVIPMGQPASASVWLELARPLSNDQATAMARFVSRSVEGLLMENIEITDQNANTVFSGMDDGTGVNITNQLELERLRTSEMEANIRAQLAPMFHEVRPMVNLVINWDSTQEHSRTVRNPLGPDTATGLVDFQRELRSNVTGEAAGAEPGLGANNMTAPDYAMGAAGLQSGSMRESEHRFLYDTVERITEVGEGDINFERSSLSVMVYTYRRYHQVYMEQHGLLGEQRWEEFRDTAQPVLMELDATVIDAVRLGTGISNVSIVWHELPVFYDRVVTPVRVEQMIMFAILTLLIVLLAYGLIRSVKVADESEIEPELSVEDLLVSTQLDEAREAEAELTTSIELAKESEVKRQIEKFVDEKPEAVANLLRNWLNDDWE